MTDNTNKEVPWDYQAAARSAKPTPIANPQLSESFEDLWRDAIRSTVQSMTQAEFDDLAASRPTPPSKSAQLAALAEQPGIDGWNESDGPARFGIKLSPDAPPADSSETTEAFAPQGFTSNRGQGQSGVQTELPQPETFSDKIRRTMKGDNL